MYNTLIISTVMSSVPVLALVIVVVSMLHKVYAKIRARYNIKVNCWFCNENTKVAYAERNSWNCPHCEQYNGFNKDGDYNREIYQQLDCSNISCSSRNSVDIHHLAPTNGFCNTCNEAQRIKVEKLAQFEPKHESRFDAELKVYKAQLEEQYRLCDTCDRHLKKVLREKKKMVLGSKFMQYVLQGANIIKHPHLVQLKQQELSIWKQRLTIWINICAIINVFCLIWSLTIPELSLFQLTGIFGDFMGRWLFYLGSHAIAFLRVLRNYIEAVCDVGLMLKLRLFCRTVFLMLLYSLGLKLPQLMRVNFTAIFTPFSPYALLLFALAQTILDSWHSVRHILLVTMWGVVTVDFIQNPWISTDAVLLLASMATLILNFYKPKECNFDTGSKNTSQSFHRLYSEDYLSECDEETLSLLSEQLNSSAASQRSNYSMKQQSRMSPRTTLNSSMHTFSTNSGHNNDFKTYNNKPMSNMEFRYRNSLHSPYAASVCSLRPEETRGSPFYASSMDLRPPNNYNQYIPAGFSNKPVIAQPMQKEQQRFGGSLLTPSRFNTYAVNTPAHFYAASHSNANHLEPQLQAQQQPFNVHSVLHEARGMDNMSRCSSHSSGFESQPNERVQRTRENICGRESVISDMDTAYLESDCQAAFRPLVQHPTREDRFNFQQFDAQLPRYRRGDLLRKYKQTQSIM